MYLAGLTNPIWEEVVGATPESKIQDPKINVLRGLIYLTPGQIKQRKKKEMKRSGY